MSGCPMTQHKNKKGRLIAETTFKAVGVTGHLSNFLVEDLAQIDRFYTNMDI